MDQIERSVMAYLSELDSDTPIELGTALMERGLLDSIGLVRLIQYLESEFGITIGDTEIVPAIFTSPATIAAFVARKKG